MPYRICKAFEVENGHQLAKHPDACRFPHGQTRRVEVVVEADFLNERDTATLGGCDKVKEWLAPCDLAVSGVQRPSLHRAVVELEEAYKADDFVLSLVTEALADAGSSVMVSVYRIGDTAVLARRISERMGSIVAGAYRSKMPAAAKA